jgi:hypothetical protein
MRSGSTIFTVDRNTGNRYLSFSDYDYFFIIFVAQPVSIVRYIKKQRHVESKVIKDLDMFTRTGNKDDMCETFKEVYNAAKMGALEIFFKAHGQNL